MWIALAAGLLISVAGFITTRTWEASRAKDEFEWRAARQMAVVARVLDQKNEMVIQVRNILVACQVLNRTNLQDILADLRKRSLGVQNWEYTELVAGADRARFESKERERVTPDFEIQDLSADGRFVLAPLRDVYLPVLYTDPPNSTHIGLDLATSPEILTCAIAARDTGEQQIVVLEDDRAMVISAVTKVFQDYVRAGQKPAELRGFVTCTFEIKAVLDEAFPEPSLDVELILEDRTPGYPSKILYRKLAEAGSTLPTVKDFKQGLFVDQINEALNRQWFFTTRPTQQWLHAHAPFACYAVLGGGIVVSILIAGYLQSLHQQRIRIDQKVVERTVELTALNARLAREVELRNHAEAVLLQAQRIGGIGSWERDLASSVLRWSEQTYRIFNQSPDRFQPTLESFRAMVHPEDLVGLEQAVETAVRTKTPYRSEHRILLLNGTERLVEEHGEVISDADGRASKLVGTVQDVTEVRQAAKTQRELEVQLRQSKKMEAVGTLAGGIAHDFNNILCAILGNAELLQSEVHENARSGDYVRQILQASHRARELVAKILTFSRPQDQKREPVRLRALIEETTSLIRSTIPARITIITKFAASSIYVLAESGPLHQVLMNLCANAWHAMGDQPGILELSEDELVANQPLAVAHGYLPPGRYAILTVRDTGAGIPAHYLERIFDPFFTTKPTGQGTGLGLAVVHGIVKSQDGGIAVESQSGAGTTFRLFLPLIEAPPTNSSEPSPTPAFRGIGRILFVDDEQALTTLAYRVLTNGGYEVSVFVDSVQALASFVRAPAGFDAVVTDFSMPHVGGAEFLQAVRKTGSQIPVLLTSGYVGEMTADDAKKRGFFDLVYKPYSAQEILEAVAKMLLSRKA